MCESILTLTQTSFSMSNPLRFFVYFFKYILGPTTFTHSLLPDDIYHCEICGILQSPVQQDAASSKFPQDHGTILYSFVYIIYKFILKILKL